MESNFKLVLCDLNKEVYEAFIKYFSDLPNVEFHNKPFQIVEEFDCIVSPANSFGLMDGGIDLHISNYFGKQLMKMAQQYIINNYAGEQPVGTSFIIHTGHSKHKYLAHTPTMRVPKDIRNTDNVYYAMKSMLLAVQRHNKLNEDKINSVLCSGLGTLSGCVPPEIASKQMRLAYEHVMNPIQEINWMVARQRDREIQNITVK